MFQDNLSNRTEYSSKTQNQQGTQSQSTPLCSYMMYTTRKRSDVTASAQTRKDAPQRLPPVARRRRQALKNPSNPRTHTVRDAAAVASNLACIHASRGGCRWQDAPTAGQQPGVHAVVPHAAAAALGGLHHRQGLLLPEHVHVPQGAGLRRRRSRALQQLPTQVGLDGGHAVAQPAGGERGRERASTSYDQFCINFASL